MTWGQPCVSARIELRRYVGRFAHESASCGVRPLVEAKQTLGVDELEVVADKGYYDGSEVKKCEQEGITVYVAKQQTSANKKRGL